MAKKKASTPAKKKAPAKKIGTIRKNPKRKKRIIKT